MSSGSQQDGSRTTRSSYLEVSRSISPVTKGPEGGIQQAPGSKKEERKQLLSTTAIQWRQEPVKAAVKPVTASHQCSIKAGIDSFKGSYASPLRPRSKAIFTAIMRRLQVQVKTLATATPPINTQGSTREGSSLDFLINFTLIVNSLNN